MAESFFNDPSTQEAPPDIYEYSAENEAAQGNNKVFHSPSAMVKELRKSFNTGLYDGRALAQTIIYLFKSGSTAEEDIEEVFSLANSLSDDYASSAIPAKMEFIEQLLFIAQYCAEVSSVSWVIPEKLLPLVVNYLGEPISEVRKIAHATLLVLLEQGLLDRRDVEAWVCPLIIELTTPLKASPPEYRTEAAALLSKLAPLLGKEVSERVFLRRFAELCSDQVPFVRQVCADNFGDFASVVGPQATEKVLLPKFIHLCRDHIWKIRKSCANEFMPVSCLVSPRVRRRRLAPLFQVLLKDDSQWVKLAALQSLGPFISTFADPSIKAMLTNISGEMIITDVEVLAVRLEVLEQKRKLLLATKTSSSSLLGGSNGDNDSSSTPVYGGEVVVDYEEGGGGEQLSSAGEEEDEEYEREMDMLMNEIVLEAAQDNNSNNNYGDTPDSSSSPASSIKSSFSTSSLHAADADSDEFNAFFYWRTPLPDLRNEDLPPDIQLSKQEVDADNEEDDLGLALGSLTEDEDDDVQMSKTTTFCNDNIRCIAKQEEDDSYQTRHLNVLDGDSTSTPPQTIVPQTLVDTFVGMIRPSKDIGVEAAHHCCAFSFPAVALTLGRSNWGLLRSAYASLAKDVEWKVRYTLAASLCELGVILGGETAGEDLLPACKGFINDLEEVRVGILKRLADFIRLLGPSPRRAFLPLLGDFLSSYNALNWRLREELAHQINELVDIYEPGEVKEAIAPIALTLLRDKVAAVRKASLGLLCRILRAFTRSTAHEGLLRGLLADLAEGHKDSSWIYRQTYADLSYQILASHALDLPQFALYVLPHLLSLSGDRVPNVRIALARVLVDHIANIDYFNNKANPCHLSVVKTLALLESDPDMDVIHYLASYPSSASTAASYSSSIHLKEVGAPGGGGPGVGGATAATDDLRTK